MAKETKIATESILQLINYIGGKDNIASVTHCLTRLRFALVDPKLANVEAIEELPFVKGCFNNAGQFQVIIGTDVESYYKLLIAQLNFNEATKEQTKAAAKQNMSLFERLISNLAEIFVPLLPALIAGGLLLGLRNIIGDMPTIDDKPLIESYPC